MMIMLVLGFVNVMSAALAAASVAILVCECVEIINPRAWKGEGPQMLISAGAAVVVGCGVLVLIVLIINEVIIHF